MRVHIALKENPLKGGKQGKLCILYNIVNIEKGLMCIVYLAYFRISCLFHINALVRICNIQDCQVLRYLLNIII